MEESTTVEDCKRRPLPSFCIPIVTVHEIDRNNTIFCWSERTVVIHEMGESHILELVIQLYLGRGYIQFSYKQSVHCQSRREEFTLIYAKMPNPVDYIVNSPKTPFAVQSANIAPCYTLSPIP